MFIRLLQRPPKPQDGNFSLQPWLFRVASNLMIDWLRRAEHGTVLDSSNHLSVPTESPTPYEAMREKDDRAELMRALHSLPESLRETVQMRIYARLKFREIAQIMNCPVPTVIWRMNRALEILRQTMMTNRGGTCDVQER